jgi:hypothetical protein
MLSALLIVERTLALPTDIWQLVGLVAFGMLVYGGFVGIAERQLIRDLKARLGTLSVPNQISETIE